MIGCFNATLYSTCDIHRIFDLLSYSLWDFILWWFDLDFVLFDFNFDFILCLSFIFLFLLHFFINIVFTFLVNFLVVTQFTVLALIHFIYIYMSWITFNTFFLIFGVYYIFHILEIYIYCNVLCFSDFITFSEGVVLSVNNSSRCISIFSPLYTLFYYNLTLTTWLYIIIISFFFSSSYCIQSNTDFIINLNFVDINFTSIYYLLIIDTNFLYSALTNFYVFTIILNFNVLHVFSMLSIFYFYSFFYVNVFLNALLINTLNYMNYLYVLTVMYTHSAYNHLFNTVVLLHTYMYIIFLFNFFGNMVNDFNFIHFLINALLLLILFTSNVNTFNWNVTNFYNNQLLYIGYL